MNIQRLTLTAGIAICGMITGSSITPVRAFTLFTGEDVNAGGNRIDINGNSTIPLSSAAELAFLNNFTGSATESFENVGSTNPANLPGIAGATIDTINSSPSGVESTPENGRFAITGTNYYRVGTSQGLTTTKITFANPMAAFGFYATDIENQEGITLLLEGTNGNTTFVIPTQANGISGAALYYGLVAENSNQTFNSVTFSLSPVSSIDKRNDRFGLDNLTVATYSQIKPVPEPFTIIGTIVGGTAALRLRKKLKSLVKD